MLDVYGRLFIASWVYGLIICDYVTRLNLTDLPNFANILINYQKYYKSINI